jgi:hypothetical protein
LPLPSPPPRIAQYSDWTHSNTAISHCMLSSVVSFKTGRFRCRQPCKAGTCVAFYRRFSFQVGHISKLKRPNTHVYTHNHLNSAYNIPL